MSASIAWIALFLLVLPGGRAFAGSTAGSFGDLSRAAALLDPQGFHCEAPSSATGLTCLGMIDGYPREVALFVPPAYHPRAHADLILQLHGFNLGGESMSQIKADFGYAQVLAGTGRDAIMIAPLSYGQCDDFKQSLTDLPEHFKAFLDHALSMLVGAGLAQTVDPASITLTGHSGGYFPLGTIVQSRVYSEKINELYLLDASYGKAEEFERFAADPKHRFWSAWHDYDPDMSVVDPQIMGYLDGLKIPYLSAPGPDLAPAEVARNRVGFVLSDVEHDATWGKYFSMFLTVSH